MKLASTVTSVSGAKWPLTGGVASQLSMTKDYEVERLYLAGYSDGSVRIWDATCPVLFFICLLEGKVRVPSNSFHHLTSLRKDIAFILLSDW